MCRLILSQVEQITSVVEQAEITISHLKDDLIDHICCDIENEMNKGLSFEEAYDRISKKFGIPGLKKIQEDTLVLIDKKYRIMKTSMKVFGNVSLALLGIGTIFKIQHWPGAGPMLVFGFLFLCIGFFPSSLMANFRETKLKGRLFFHIAAFVGGINYMLGVLFKIQHWPGSHVLWMTGWFFILCLALPALMIMKVASSKDKREIHMAERTSVRLG